jgi:hypothetical protein
MKFGATLMPNEAKGVMTGVTLVGILHLVGAVDTIIAASPLTSAGDS